jgi:catalase
MDMPPMDMPPAIFGRLVAIGAIVLGVAVLFVYTGGWLSPHRLTPDRMVAALSERGGNPLGHRRNHSKGTCFTGTFEANGAGVRLSTTPIFTAGSYPVIGRFAIATGDPNAADATGRDPDAWTDPRRLLGSSQGGYARDARGTKRSPLF